MADLEDLNDEDDLTDLCEAELFLDDLWENWTLPGVLGDVSRECDNEDGDGEL